MAILILYMVLIAKKHAKRKCTLDNDVDPFANPTIRLIQGANVCTLLL